MLQRYGADVTAVAGGEEAVEVVRKSAGTPFDMILMDLQVSKKRRKCKEFTRGIW